VNVFPYGSESVLVEVDSLDDVLGLTADLEMAPPFGVIDVVPAARSVMIWFDGASTDFESVRRDLLDRDIVGRSLPPGKEIEVPVVYDGEDLAHVAEKTGLKRSEVVRRHMRPTYVVAFIGMAPGFYFLAGGDPSLRVPRRQSPRSSVPLGSVGLAGEFTGIYPKWGPGGWQLIGTTPAELWDSDHYPAALLAPGTRVRFVERELA
jgi:KipI family sensor histidine kinase inhibitor